MQGNGGTRCRHARSGYSGTAYAVARLRSGRCACLTFGKALIRISRPVKSKKKQPFARALAMYSTVPPHERKDLYALRNAFVHDYSLMNCGRAGDHLFKVTWDKQAPLITLQKRP